jgi:hypothetical protein
MTAHESSTTRFQSQPSPCPLIEDLLPLYVEGEVSAGTRDLIVEHLAQCNHCAGFLAGAQSVRAQLRHDQQSRSHVIAEDRPALQAMHAVQFAVATGAVLAIGMLGLLGLALPLALIVPLGAGLAACYAIVMLMRQRRGIQLFDGWFPLGAVAMLGGLGLLVLLTQFEQLLGIAGTVLRHTPFYLLYRLYGEFPIMTLGAFGVMLVMLVGLALSLVRKHGPTGNPE